MVMHNSVCLYRLREQLWLELLLLPLPIIGEEIFQQLNWTQDCCWMVVDEHRLDELQLETPI